jgi:hypothetical protein
MSDRLKTCALFVGIAGLWMLMPQTGFADSVQVPEPGTLSLLAGGVAVTMLAAWRRRK